MTAYNDMMAALHQLKEKFGSPLTKELILLGGGQRAVDIHPALQRTAQHIAEKMVAANSQKEAAVILVAEYREMDETPSNYLCELAHMVRGDACMVEVQHMVRGDEGKPTTPPTQLPSPNEVIAALLEIAAAAQRTVDRAPERTADQAVADYRALADAFAPLQQLPGPAGVAPAMRAADYLKTFTSGLDLGKDIKQVMLTHVQDSVEAMADYIRTHGIPEPTGRDTLWGFPVVMQATADAVLVGESTERIRRGTPLGKAPSTLGLHQSFRAEQFDKIVHAYHQVFDPAPTMPVEDITANVIEFVMNSSKMDIPHGHPVTIGAPCAIYEVAYVDNLLNAVADLALDGKRFRTLAWLFEENAKPVGDENSAVNAADDILCSHEPRTADEFRHALDAVRRAGLVPDSNDKLDSATEAEGVRVKALELARATVVNRRRWVSGLPYCAYCAQDIPFKDDDPLAEKHEPGCPVITARQLIEDQT